ncbi:MAG: cytochrome c oxidase assembly protein [Methylobacter sp.]
MQANPLKPFIFIELAAMTLLAFCYVEIEGAFSRHMLIHISLMTVIAPVLASLLLKLRYSSAQPAGVATLFAVIILQTALLFAWHSPAGIGLAMTGYSGALLMQASLFFAALWFWQTIFSQTGEHVWRAVIALLLTGKLFCLIAILLVFAPRALYAMAASGMIVDLADQQLAGLLMVTVCPITYVLAAVVLISRWFQALFDSQSNVISENSLWQSR